MRNGVKILRTFILAAVAALAIQTVHAQSNTPDRAKVLRAAADALGMVRWSDIGAGATRLPGIDVITTMEIFASGTVYNGAQPTTAEYHAALAYIPPAMRVEITRKGAGEAASHTIQT